MAETGRGKSIAVWVLSGLLAALFLFAGGQKLLGAGGAVEHFSEWGYPPWFRVVIGLIEIAGGLLLLVPSVAFYAAGALGMVMIGAIYTLLTKGGPDVPVPIVCLLVLAFVASARRPSAGAA
jgi:putative oxidoreductase